MRRVENGDYPTAEAVIDEALRVLEEQQSDYRRYLVKAIAEGIHSAETEPLVDATPEFHDALVARVLARSESRSAPAQ